ncbi:Vta1 like-domain-containing protein [Peziza echinospora]|nr:Vta1 like-domain-containing protein [Peziza echinospora]
MPISKPPSKLKAVTPFITRAHQIEKTDPVIAYWCYFWAVQIIISSQLHSGDSDCTAYTTDLLDELEQRKERLLPNDTVTDDLAAQAYIENFALKVFANADNALQARKVSRQTADTFLAAATFLELCKIFPDVDAEIHSKIKFSKYQATRIIKAFQAGEDPNLPPPTEQSGGGSGLTPPRPFVEDALDEDSRPTESHYQARSPSPPTPPGRPPFQSQSTSTSDRFPLHQSPYSDQNYFPQMPINRSFSPIGPERTSSLNTPQDVLSPFHQPSQPQPPPSAPPEHTLRETVQPWQPPQSQFPTPSLPQFPPQHYDQSSSTRYTASTSPPPPPRPPQFVPSSPKPQPPPPPPQNMHNYYTNSPASTPAAQNYAQQPPPPQQNYYNQPAPPPPPPTAAVDEESITKAQKHAKWAISALNYDDIPTAVKELRAALKVLGAS